MIRICAAWEGAAEASCRALPPRAALKAGATSPELPARLRASPRQLVVEPVELASLVDALAEEA